MSRIQAGEFVERVHDVTRRHEGKKIIQTEDKIIPLRLERALIYTSIRAPTQWELDNIPQIIMISQEQWDPITLNDDMPGNVVLPDKKILSLIWGDTSNQSTLLSSMLTCYQQSWRIMSRKCSHKSMTFAVKHPPNGQTPTSGSSHP